MLTLSRKIGETIIISAGGHQIEITVQAVHGNQVRLATAAPKCVAVDRKEIYQRKLAGVPHV